MQEFNENKKSLEKSIESNNQLVYIAQLEAEVRALKLQNERLLNSLSQGGLLQNNSIDSQDVLNQLRSKGIRNESISKMMIHEDGSFEFLHLSDYCKMLFELSEAENTPKEVFKKIYPEDLTLLMQHLDWAAKTLEFVTCELRVATQSHPEKWLKLIMKPEIDAGKVVISSLFSDITELRANEVQQKLMALIVTHSTNMFVIANEKGKIVWVNDQFEHITGYKRDEVIGKSLGSFLQGPETDAAQVARMNAAIKSQTPFKGEILNYTKEGKPYWLWLEIQPIFNNEGVFEKFIAIETDITERKIREKELRANEEKFRLITENIQDGIFILNNQSKIIFASSNFRSQMDFEPNEDLTDVFPYLLDLVHPEEKEQININVANAFATNARKLNSYFRTYTHKGRLLWREDFATLTYNTDGTLDKIYVVCRDITDRKLKEQQLQLRANLLANIGQAVIATDSNGVIIFWNKQAELLFEWQNIDIEGVNIVDFIQNPDFKETTKFILQKLQHGENFKAELMIPTKTQRMIPTAISVSSSFNAAGELSGFVAILEDISERKKTENEIRKLSLAIEQGFSIAVITDINGTIEYVNPRFTEVTGYTLAEVLGKNPKLLKSGQTPKSTYNEMWATLKNGNVWKGEFLNQKKNGQLYWESAIISPIMNENHEIVNYIALKEDITIKKQNEKELMTALETVNLQNNKLMDFTYVISHNLRSHAANFHGLIQLSQQSDSIEEIKGFIDLMHVASVNLLDTLKHLNDIVKIQKSTKLESKLLLIHSVIDQVCGSLVFDLSDNGIRLFNEVDKETAIKVNEAYFESIMLNLITNAIKYRSMERTPIIKISSFKLSDKRVCISVNDNGIGIDLEKNGDKVFKMYQTFSNRPDAKGLGLYIVKNQVNAMGGEISIESQHNVGTTFKVILPIAE